jgi:hypothetical protein
MRADVRQISLEGPESVPALQTVNLKDSSWPTPACQPTTTKHPFFILDGTYFAFVQRDAFPYRLYSPRSTVASPSQNRLWVDTYPARRTPAGPAPPPPGHSLAILFRFFFDPLRTRPGTGQAEWRGLRAGRDRGMYQIDGRRKQQQGRSGKGYRWSGRPMQVQRPLCLGPPSF